MSENDDASAEDDSLFPGMFGILLGVITAVLLGALTAPPIALAGGAVVGYLVRRRLRRHNRWSGPETVDRSPWARKASTELREVGAELDAVAEEVPADGRLPVARGILDRANRYLDHRAHERARRETERARRVGGAEAAVRSTLVDARSVRQHVGTVREVETLLRDAEDAATTDVERAVELVGEAERAVDRLVPDLREEAEDRASAARRAGARGDEERARELWSDAYELATAALAIGVDEPPSGDLPPDGTATGDARRRSGEEGEREEEHPDDPSDSPDSRSAPRRETEREF